MCTADIFLVGAREALCTCALRMRGATVFWPSSTNRLVLYLRCAGGFWAWPQHWGLAIGETFKLEEEGALFIDCVCIGEEYLSAVPVSFAA